MVAHRFRGDHVTHCCKRPIATHVHDYKYVPSVYVNRSSGTVFDLVLLP